MNKFNYYLDVFKHYTKFNGRANLPQFWYFVLFNFIISFIINIISHNLNMIYGLFILIPSLAIGSRRLHDIGKSGWWQLLMFIPVIGWIWLIVLFAKRGSADKNIYGEAKYEVSKRHNLEKKIDNVIDKAQNLKERLIENVDDLSNNSKEDIQENKEDIEK